MNIQSIAFSWLLQQFNGIFWYFYGLVVIEDDHCHLSGIKGTAANLLLLI